MNKRRKGRGAVQIALPLLPVAVFLVAVYGVWLTAGGAAEQLAGWIEAVAAALTLMAAVVAAMYAKGALDLEQEREERRLDADRRAQAVLVSAWAGTSVVDRKSLPAGHPSALAEDELVLRESGRTAKVEGIWVRNASPLPVLAAIVDITMTAYMPEAYEERELGVMEAGLVPPAEEPVFKPFPAHLETTRISWDADWVRDGMEVDYEVGLRFRDSAGTYWHRTRDGDLRPEGSPRSRTGQVP